VWQWAEKLPASPVHTCWHGSSEATRSSQPQSGWVSRGMAVPSIAHLNWMPKEIGAIGHFNMGTFQACGIGTTLMEGNMIDQPEFGFAVPSPETFAPTAVNTDSWIQALASFGVERAVLVVSHGCGFNTFPSKTRFEEFGFEYNYTIAQSPWKNGTGDIAAEFVASCKKYGVKPAFYHGAINNAYLHVVHGRVQDGPACSWCPNITQDQYTQVLTANLRQLWTDYGELAEVWFDGGFPQGSEEPITKLLAELQPKAVAFQGPGENSIRWCGTEGGHVKYPFWSTETRRGLKGPGDPHGAVFAPGEADTCFQTGRGVGATGPYGGCWFYNHGMVPKSLPELVSSYHDTVGSNSFWLLDWTPMPNGTMRQDHIERYEELGNWLRSCYTIPVASVHDPTGNLVTMKIPPNAQIDRVVLTENQINGERAQFYKIMVDGAVVATGSSIGNKRIQVFNRTRGMELSVLVDGEASVSLKSVEAFNCSQTPQPQGCSFVKAFKYKIVEEITIKTLTDSSSIACCSACRSESTCAVFVFESGKCTLLSANQGGDAVEGVLSGSPKGHDGQMII